MLWFKKEHPKSEVQKRKFGTKTHVLNDADTTADTTGVTTASDRTADADSSAPS
jgi:hypothetical protein